jgi:hypothetical protein
VRDEHYGTVQRAFLCLPQVKAAWKTVLTEVGDVMKAGAAMCDKP